MISKSNLNTPSVTNEKFILQKNNESAQNQKINKKRKKMTIGENENKQNLNDNSRRIKSYNPDDLNNSCSR